MKPLHLVVACAAVVSAACSSSSPSHSAAHGAEEPTRVSTAVAEQKEVPVYLFGLGTAQGMFTARVHSQVDGRIKEVHFKEGETVREGQPLVSLDPRPFRIALQQADAALARDLALLRNNRLNRDRNRTLLAKDLIAQGTVTDAEALAAEGEATVESDRAAVASAKLQLEYAQVRAPIGGRTGVRLVDPGNLVHANDTNALVVIAQVDPISVVSTMAEQELPRLQQALLQGPVVAEALSQDGNQVWARGTLSVIDNAIDTTTGTLRLKSTFANPNNTLWPGQFVRTRFITQILPQALMVPQEAVLHGDEGDFVYVVGEDLHVRVRPVTTGVHATGDVQILSGLKASERVVIEGQFRLKDHAQVILDAKK